MNPTIPMSHEQVLAFLFTPESERRPEDVAAWHEALQQAEAEQQRHGWDGTESGPA